MKKMILAAAVASLFAAAPASAQNVGDWVLSQWRGSAQYFPGIVTGRDGNTVRVRFDDGAVENRPANLVRPFDWRAGSQVECRWTDGNWYAATIQRIGSDGLTLNVRYNADGVVQNTNTGRCRVG